VPVSEEASDRHQRCTYGENPLFAMVSNLAIQVDQRASSQQGVLGHEREHCEKIDLVDHPLLAAIIGN
jgi:hypothetical protein